MRPKVSIIVPAWNAQRTLEACLRGCRAQSYSPIEVMVVDDGSTDDSAMIAAAAGARVLSQSNAGPAAARNLGAADATGTVLAFTDSDCVPQRDWIEHLVRALEHGATAVGGAYAIANDTAPLAVLVQEEIALRHEGFTAGTDFLGSFNLAVWREAFEEVGGFDPAFRAASGEDNDLAYRLQDRGATFAYVPEAVVAHHHPERLLPYLRTQARHGYWRVWLYAKHPRRTRGDRYAGPLDFVAPVMALGAMATAALVPISLLLGFPALVPAVCLVAALGDALAVALLRLPWAQRIAARARMLDAGYTLFVLVARDFARAIGLARGAASLAIRGGRRR